MKLRTWSSKTKKVGEHNVSVDSDGILFKSTGIIDIKDKTIFEGDIVEALTFKGYGKSKESVWIIKWDSDRACFYFSDSLTKHHNFEIYDENFNDFPCFKRDAVKYYQIKTLGCACLMPQLLLNRRWHKHDQSEYRRHARDGRTTLIVRPSISGRWLFKIIEDNREICCDLFGGQTCEQAQVFADKKLDKMTSQKTSIGTEEDALFIKQLVARLES